MQEEGNQHLKKVSTVLVSVLGLIGLAVLAHHKSGEEGTLVLCWTSNYLFFVLIPAFGLWLFHILFISSRRFKNSFARKKILKIISAGIFLSIIIVCCLVESNVYQARIYFFILSISAIILLLSFSFHLKDLILTYLCFIFFGTTLFAFEIPQLLETRHNKLTVRWGDQEMFKHLFNKHPPFIGTGGRLRSNLRFRMTSAEADLLGVRFETNEWGFRNDESFPEKPESNEIRILSMGDSFSTGYGIDQDQFLGPLLEQNLKARFSSDILVMNAEVSDPAYGLYYFQNYADRFSPKVIIYNLCGNDMIQSYWFISFFKVFKFDQQKLVPGEGSKNDLPIFKDPNVNFWDKVKDITYPGIMDPAEEVSNTPMVFRPLIQDFLKFRFSIYLKRLFKVQRNVAEGKLNKGAREVIELERSDGKKRLIDGYWDLGFFYKKNIPIINEMYDVFFKAVHAMALKARQDGELFILVYFPQRFQVQKDDWELFKDRWNLNEKDFDLNLPNKRISDFCRLHEIPFLDLTVPYREKSIEHNLYLPNDAHPNQYGHALAAQALTEFLSPEMKKMFYKPESQT